MHTLSIPCIVMASINVYVGAYYLCLYLKLPKIREHLPFALLCMSVGCYDLFCVGLYNSHSIRDGILWQRLQFETAAAISVFMIWFTGVFTEQKGNRLIRYLLAWFIIIPLVSLFANREYTLSTANPSDMSIILPNLPRVTYHEGAVGIIYQVEILSAVFAYLYLFYLFIRYYLETREKTLLLVIFCQTTYFLGVINDFLVSMRYYSFLYVSEYSFFFIIISMAYVLLGKFADLQTAYEDLNARLEQKVHERTRDILEAQAQVKRLEGIIPICMYCKQICDDKKSWHQLERYITENSEAQFSHGICPACLENLKEDLE